MFLVAADQFGFEPYLVTGTAHVGGLDEVVAHDGAAEQTERRQAAQPAILHERRGADQRNVPPVRGPAQLQSGEPCRDDRTVSAARELLQTSERRARIDDGASGLQNADLRLALHEIDHAQQRRAAHQAVGVQHHEVAVTAAPAPQEVRDVAALVAQMRDAAAIMNAAEAVQLLTEPMPTGLPGQPHLGVAAIGKYVEIELVEMTGA